MVTKSRLKRVWIPGHIFVLFFFILIPFLEPFWLILEVKMLPETCLKNDPFLVSFLGGNPPQKQGQWHEGLTLWAPGKTTICTKK